MSPSAEFLKHDNVSLGNMLNIKGTGSGVFELRIDCRGRYRTYSGRSRGLSSSCFADE
jgi:putative component of toxin-antitoxin plasmid stabilization module